MMFVNKSRFLNSTIIYKYYKGGGGGKTSVSFSRLEIPRIRAYCELLGDIAVIIRKEGWVGVLNR